jgi:hypothetical protein
VRALTVLWLAAAGLLSAQAPRIGVIDFYGLRRTSEKHLREAIGVRAGDALPRSKGDLEDRLERVSGVVRALVTAVCCEGDRTILYVGVEEKDAPHFEFRPEPDGDVTLPVTVSDSYRFLLGALESAARAGPVSENLAQGQAMSSDPAARAIQERLGYLAGDNLPVLRRVLRESSDASQRVAAAYALGYAPAKRLVVDDLQYALRDPDESVRASAVRALTAIAVLGARDKALEIRVEATWFIQMLNSLVWGDRNRAAAALVSLTEPRDPYVLDQIRETALQSLAEMAHWKTLEHALPAFLVLGRVAGLPEDQIQSAWSGGNREALIELALKRQEK